MTIRVSDITPIIRKVFASYPNSNLSNETLAAYIDLLGDIPLDHLQITVNQCLIECLDFPPSAGRIRQRYIELITPPKLPAADAWGLVIRQMMRVGHTGTPTFEDATLARVVQSMGWRELCLSENQMADRAHFIRMYEQVVSATHAARIEAMPTRQLSQAARGQLSSDGPVPLKKLLQGGFDGR